MKQSIEDIKGTLTRRKMQARQIHPNAIIVPYDRAMKAIDNVVRYYEDGVKEEFREAMRMTNLAFVLSDVVLSCTKKADECLSKVGKSFRHEDKVNFNRMRNAVNSARMTAEKSAEAIYHLKDAKLAKMDSDWFFEVADLCMTKISENQTRAIMITSWLKSMKDEEVVFK